MIGNHEKISITLGRLEQLESDTKELERAKKLIDRLRAENTVLKSEKKRFLSVVDSCKRHIAIAGNAHKKWAVTMVKSQLLKARLV